MRRAGFCLPGVLRPYQRSRTNPARRGVALEPREFLDRVEEDRRYRLLPPSGDRAVVQHVAAELTWEVDLARVREFSWGELDGVLSGKRPARVLMKISRIVGYYSRLASWNSSKLAELRDRHRGDYRL